MIINCHITGISYTLKFIDDANEPLITIVTKSKTDIKIVCDIIGSKKEKLLSYFRKKINEIAYKIYDEKILALNKETEEINMSNNEILYSIYLYKLS